MVLKNAVQNDESLIISEMDTINFNTGEIRCGTVAEQTTMVLDNIKYVLNESKRSMNDIAKVVVYLRRSEYRSEVEKICKAYLKSNKGKEIIFVDGLSNTKHHQLETRRKGYEYSSTNVVMDVIAKARPTL